jgi:hypothetical protein
MHPATSSAGDGRDIQKKCLQTSGLKLIFNDVGAAAEPCQSKRRNGYDSANSILYDRVVHPGAFGDERTMEYAVKAETKEGDVITLRRGFPSRSDAEDYPVRLSLWRRVWVERELSEPTPAS